MALAHLTINLDAFTGDDHPPVSSYSTITLDPGADHIDAAADVIHVRTIVVSLDQQGKAATANGVPCVDGKVPIVAGVMYAVSAPNVLRDGPHYIPALTAGQVVDLSDYITPGAPLTPDQAAILTARIVALEETPPDHGALTGLGEDDHPQYALADGTRGAFAAPLGAEDNYVTDAEKAALHGHSNKAALDLVSGTNTGDQVLPTWSTISGKPAVVAEGATQAAARTAIGAGTSSLVVGTGAGDAKAGNYQPTAANVSDSTATGRALLTAADAAAARTALGLGTAATTASTAYATDAELSDGLAQKRAKGDTITPDDFTGTDRARLQAAVNYCTANGYPTIILDRMLDLTGQPAVSIDKSHWSVRDTVTFEGTGGGIIKHDAGVVFTSATENTGDLSFRGVKYVSTAGAGAILLDADKLLRTFSTNCEYKNWDLVARQIVIGRWAQSMRFLSEKIIGGSGPAFLFRESIDCTFDDILCENRLTGTAGGLFANSEALPIIANRNLRIINSCVESCSGIPIRLAMSYGSVLKSNYFEYTGQPADPQIDLSTLSSTQIALTLASNTFVLKPEQIAAHTPAVLLSGSRVGLDVVVSTGNVIQEGTLYKFGAGIGDVYGIGDRAENNGQVIHPAHEMNYRTPAGKVVTTATRPANPPIGQSVFDSTLGKPVWARTAGTNASIALQFSGGASTSGTITITLGGVVYAVPVTAGDTAAAVRNKVVAAAVFWPVWATTPFDTAVVSFDAFRPGRVTGALTFNAGGTGVTQDSFAYNSQGSDAVWVDGSGATV